MPYTNSPLVSYTKLSPCNSGTRTHSIDRITPHCVVGQLTAAGICNISNWLVYDTQRGASANYVIGSDLVVGLSVPESKRAWTSSSKENDERAVTIECASDKTHPYAFKTEVYMRLIELCTDICRRNGKKKLIWFGDKAKTLTYQPAADEMVLTVHRWFANKACVPTYTEVLTKHGWVKISDVEVGDEIACADLDGMNITFEEVYDKVPVRKQDTYTSNGLTATKDHRMVYSYQQSKNFYRIDTFNRCLHDGSMVYIPMAGNTNYEGLQLSNSMIAFLVAVQADGHYMTDSRLKTPGGYYGLEFHLKKQRKIERIKSILDDLHFEYTEKQKGDGTVSIRMYGSKVVTDICEKYLEGKKFTWEWLGLSNDQASFFLKEILLWDGNTDINSYFSTEHANLDVVSAIAATHNVGSNVSGDRITFRENPYMTLGNPVRNHSIRDTTVTCVSVRTGIFLCRQNGKTFIIGNCPGDWLYSRLGDVAMKVTASLNNNNLTAENAQNTSKAGVKMSSGATKASSIAALGSEQEKAAAMLELVHRCDTSGILNSVTTAQMILESGYCGTDLAKEANNCFGMKKSLSGNTWSGSTWDGRSTYTKRTAEQKADGTVYYVTADFRKYPCVEDSIRDHAAYLMGAKAGFSRRYAGLEDAKTYQEAIHIIKSGGYATDTRYEAKICSIIERYGLDRYDGKEVTPDKPASHWIVQAGSFNKEENADAQVEKLKAKGIDAFKKEVVQ